MMKKFGWLAPAALAAAVAGCESIWMPADLEPRFHGSIEGSIDIGYTGSGHFYSGSVPRRPPGVGPQLFTIESYGIGSARGMLIQLTRSDTALPEPGTYRLGEGDGDWRAQLTLLTGRGATREAYAAESGELVIAATSADALEGSVRFDAVRRCTGSNGAVHCFAGEAPPDAPRLGVRGEFTAVRGR